MVQLYHNNVKIGDIININVFTVDKIKYITFSCCNMLFPYIDNDSNIEFTFNNKCIKILIHKINCNLNGDATIRGIIE